MRLLMLGASFVAVCLSSSAFAASAETDAFVANVRVNGTFLEKASSLANDRSESTELRAFAGREGQAVKAVIGTIDARTAPEMVAQAEPVTLASNEVITGRSAAIDPPPAATAFSAPTGTGALMPAAAITLDHLSASKGQAFDKLFKATQVNALRQLAALYNAYAMTGDDAALKQLAKSEFAATNDRIAEIARF